MLKLLTEIDCGKSRTGISYEDKILVIGSCFADNIGLKMSDAGFDVLVNPFGTLYNPVSVCNSIARMAFGVEFTHEDCVEMGAGAGLICSYSHHTSFARSTEEEFLSVANDAFRIASDFYKNCNKLIITLGTSWCYKHDGEVVSNCLKRPASEFSRDFLPESVTLSVLSRMMQKAAAGKQCIFTVSPIRHLADGAHGNQLSKAALLRAVDALCMEFPERAEYFPAYEIMLDELRDYRFYAEDMVHPSAQAVNHIWERFIDFALPAAEKERLAAAEKQHRQSLHRQMH